MLPNDVTCIVIFHTPIACNSFPAEVLNNERCNIGIQKLLRPGIMHFENQKHVNTWCFSGFIKYVNHRIKAIRVTGAKNKAAPGNTAPLQGFRRGNPAVMSPTIRWISSKLPSTLFLTLASANSRLFGVILSSTTKTTAHVVFNTTCGFRKLQTHRLYTRYFLSSSRVLQ